MTNYEETLRKMLIEALQEYGEDYGYVITDKSVKKLMDAIAFEDFHVEDCTPKLLEEALMSLGKVLDQSDDESEYVAAIGAGVANMNAAFVAIVLAEDTIYIMAAAREGLIKQGTAKKSIERIKMALTNSV